VWAVATTTGCVESMVNQVVSKWFCLKPSVYSYLPHSIDREHQVKRLDIGMPLFGVLHEGDLLPPARIGIRAVEDQYVVLVEVVQQAVALAPSRSCSGYLHNSSDASRAPSAMARSLAQTISGSTW